MCDVYTTGLDSDYDVAGVAVGVKFSKFVFCHLLCGSGYRSMTKLKSVNHTFKVFK